MEKEIVVRVEPGTNSVRPVEINVDGIWFCAFMRMEEGSSLTADPNNRPSKIVIEATAALIRHFSDKFNMPTFQAPPRNEFLDRLRVIEGQMRELHATLMEILPKVAAPHGILKK